MTSLWKFIIRVISIAVISTVLFTSDASAFGFYWVFVFGAYPHVVWVHAEITDILLSHQELGLPCSAVSRINRYAQYRDDAAVQAEYEAKEGRVLQLPPWDSLPYAPEQHFDRPNLAIFPDVLATYSQQAFANGVAFVNAQRQAALSALQNNDPHSAVVAIGRALHALQDAFSHSNYVDLTPTQQDSFFQALFVAGSNPPTDLKLTFWNPDIPPADDLYPHDPNAKDTPTDPGGGQKDPNGVLKFDLAKAAAERATLQFIQKLQQDAGSNWTQLATAFVTPQGESSPECGQSASGSRTTQSVASLDPNDKAGSQGAGTQQYISAQEPLRYAAFFENVATATAAAQQVVITDPLDPTKDDLNTVSLGPIAFGNQLVTPPPGTTGFARDVDLRPTTNLIVRIKTHLDQSTSKLTWTFSSIDPATGLPPSDPTVGFLPPNVTPPQGQGSVLFTVFPKQGLTTGTQVQNQASVIFDANAPIATPIWTNTIDSDKPTSHVLALPAFESSTTFTIQWTGTDVGAGVQDYTIYVSDNSGPLTPFVVNSTATSVTFTGQLGHTYGFLSQARDLVGNIENLRTIPDTTTRTSTNLPPVANAGPNQTVECSGHSGTTVTLNGSASTDPDGDALTFVWKNPANTVVGNTAVITQSLLLGTFNYSLTVTDSANLSSTAGTSVTVRDTTPPALSLSKSTVVAVIPTASATTMPVSLAGIASATDICDASPTITNNAPSLFAIGLTNVTFTATDHSGNASQKSLPVQVEYVFGGINPPIPKAVFSVGQSVPVKFQLFAADHTIVSTAVANLQAFRVTSTGLVPVTVIPAGTSNTGTLFRYDPVAKQYVYTLSTHGYISATYVLRVVLNDGTTHDVSIVIH